MLMIKKIIVFSSIILVFAACGRKKVLSPEEEARLNAQSSIERAEKMLETCEEEEVSAEEAEELVDEAREAFDDSDYVKAKDKADAGYQLAKKMLEDAMAERKRAMEEAKKELSDELPAAYTVGTWAKDRDCLWNIAAKPEIYDDSWQWKKIYLANRNKIKNPDLIYTGQVFKIPR